MLSVLLVSPLDPDVPGNLKYLVGGENTYARTLLKYPPKGATYTHFEDALKRGLVEYLPLNGILKFLVKFRILPLSAGSRCLKINNHFDLVHCHSFSIKIIPSDIPVLLSDSSSNYLFLRDYVHWPIWRIKIGYLIRKLIFEKLGVIDPDVNLGRAKKLLVFSQFGFKIHKQLGADSKKMVVIPPGLPKMQIGVDNKNNKNLNILFVGIWFERKGGPMVLEAFKRLSAKYPNITLTIVGPIPDRNTNNGSRVTHYDFVPREKLMREIFPKADIFVLVPPVAEGFGFVVLEAMSFGIPAIVSRVYALPELVSDGKTGFVIEPGSLDQLIEKLEILITDRKLCLKMGEAAKKRFDLKFSVEVMHRKLVEIYREVVSYHSLSSTDESID